MRSLKILFLFISFIPINLGAEQSCIYTDNNGIIKEASSIDSIPDELKDKVKCFKTRVKRAKAAEEVVSDEELIRSLTIPNMAAPDQIELDGALRKERLLSPLGTIELRWPRSAESIIGKDPARATVDAARMVSRTLLQSGFPSTVNRIDTTWSIVFMDEKVPTHQVPTHLITNCHPAWMTPPANIYVVVQRVAGACGNQNSTKDKTVNDAKLAQIMAHEMAHVIEYNILGEKFANDRLRAEGFATWFESVAAEYSNLLDANQVMQEKIKLAYASIQTTNNIQSFNGSAEDYSRASIYFHAVVKDRGIKGLMRVYSLIKDDAQLSFTEAVEKEFGWTETVFNQKAVAFLEKNM